MGARIPPEQAPQEGQPETNPVEAIAQMLGALSEQLPPELGERMLGVQQEFIAIAEAAAGGGGAPEQGGAVPAEQGGIPAGPQGMV